MSKSLPVPFVTEKNRTAAAPFNVMLVQFAGGTVALTDQAQVGSPILGATNLPIVKDWGRLDGVLNLREGLGTISSLRITGLNHPGTGGSGATRFSDLFPATSLEATFVSLAQCMWVGGAPGGTLTSYTFFSGVIQDPIQYSETTWSFDVLSLPAHYLTRDYGVPINQNDFPYLDLNDRGRVIPSVYGVVRGLPLLGLKSRSATYPVSTSTNQSSIALSDVIVSSAQTVQESWTLTFSNADAFVPTGFTTATGVFLTDIAWNNSVGADGLLYATDGSSLYSYVGGWLSTGFNAPTSARFLSLGSYAGKLYAGGLSPAGKNSIWRLDSTGWTAIFSETGAFAQGGIDRLGASTSRPNVLLAGSQPFTNGNSALYSYNGATTTLDRSQPNNSSGNIYSNFADFAGSLYVAEREAAGSTVNLLRWSGSAWTVAHTGVAGDLSNTVSLFVFGATAKLYSFGASGAPNHPKTFTWDGANWALDNDFGSHVGTGGAIVYNAAAYVFYNDSDTTPYFSKNSGAGWSPATVMAQTADRAALYTIPAGDAQLFVIGETASGSASTIAFDDTVGAYSFTLTGSVTGADGVGVAGVNFVSNSLKIGIDHTFWSGVPARNGDTITFTADNTYFEYALSLTSPTTPLADVLAVYVDNLPDTSFTLLQNQTRASQTCAVIQFKNQRAPQLVNTLSGSGQFNGATGVNLGIIPGLTNLRVSITPVGGPTSVTPYVQSKSATAIVVAAGNGDTESFDFTVRQDLEGIVTADLLGIQDDSLGTFTGTPNAILKRPAHVIHHFLQVGCGVPAASIDSAGTFVTADSSMPANYAFNGAVVLAEPLQKIVAAMCRQARLLFDWPIAARLFFRPTTYAGLPVTKALTESVIKESSINVQRTPVAEIINDVNVRYLRDWSKARGVNAYRRLQRVTDSTSIGLYGDRISSGLTSGLAADDLFMFDFVIDDSMAADLAAFYLARFKFPTRRIAIDAFLDQFELDRGDIITISYAPGGTRFDSLAGTTNLLVERVINLPGSATRADTVRITCIAL